VRIRHILFTAILISLMVFSSPIITLVPAHAQTTPLPSIVVQVSDPQGINIDGALVEIFLQPINSLVSGGKTVNGTFVSSPLQTGLTYTVVASTSVQTEQQNIVLFNGTNSFVQFTLLRSFPLSQILLSRVSWQSQVPGSQTLTGLFTFANTGQVDITDASVSFTSPSPIAVIGASSQFSLGAISIGNTRDLTVTFAITPIQDRSVYSIPYSLTYTDIYQRTITQNGTFGLVYNPPPPSAAYELVVSSSNYTLEHIDTGYAGVATFVLTDLGPLNITSSTIQFNSTAGITVVGASTLFGLGDIPVGSQYVLTFSFTLATSSNQASYSLPYIIAYTDTSNVVTTERGQANFVLNSSPDVKIASVDVSSTKLEPGNDATLIVNLANIGDSKAVNLAVAVSGMPGALSSNSSYIGILNSGSSASTSFGLNIPTNFSPGTYSIDLNITYQDGSGRIYSSGQVYYVNVFSRGIPIVEVQNTITDPVVLYTSTNGLMTFYLTNVGNDIARNVLVQITGGSHILASSVFTLGQINPNATQTAILGLNVSPDSPPGTFMLGVQLKYTNPLGQAFNQTSFVELTIYQAPTIFTPINEAIMAGVGVVAVGGVIVARKLNLKI